MNLYSVSNPFIKKNILNNLMMFKQHVKKFADVKTTC